MVQQPQYFAKKCLGTKISQEFPAPHPSSLHDVVKHSQTQKRGPEIFRQDLPYPSRGPPPEALDQPWSQRPLPAGDEQKVNSQRGDGQTKFFPYAGIKLETWTISRYVTKKSLSRCYELHLQTVQRDPFTVSVDKLFYSLVNLDRCPLTMLLSLDRHSPTDAEESRQLCVIPRPPRHIVDILN